MSKIMTIRNVDATQSFGDNFVSKLNPCLHQIDYINIIFKINIAFNESSNNLQFEEFDLTDL